MCVGHGDAAQFCCMSRGLELQIQVRPWTMTTYDPASFQGLHKEALPFIAMIKMDARPMTAVA